jgi:hypothetical protein
MFNTRRNRRRPVAPSAPYSRARRLRIEAMESRLLLSGNQLTGGDLDTTIWHFSNNGYMVIADDTSSALDTNASGANATDGTPVVQNPGNSNLGYYSDAGLIHWDDTAVGLSSDYHSYRFVLKPGELTSLFDSRDANADYVLQLESEAGLQLRAKLNLLQNSLQAGARDYFHEFLSSDSLLNSGSFGPGMSLGIGSGVVTSSSPAAPVVELVITKSFDSAIIGGSLTGSGITVAYVSIAPTTESNPADSKPTDANVAVPQVGSVADIVAANPAKVVADLVERITILPERQTANNEILSETIDDLLSGDTIIVAPSDKSGHELFVDGAPAGPADNGSLGLSADGQPVGESAVEQIADGGMIPLDVIVAIATDHRQALATTDEQLALYGSTDVDSHNLVGEMSRVAVMELIEGQPEPGAAPSSAEQVSLFASADAPPAPFTRLIEFASHQTGLAIGLVAPVDTSLLAGVASAARHAFATIVTTAGPSAAPTEPPLEDARSQAFSQLGDDEDTEATASPSAIGWLDAAPLAFALACERAIAARQKRRDSREADRTPSAPK